MRAGAESLAHGLSVDERAPRDHRWHGAPLDRARSRRGPQGRPGAGARWVNEALSDGALRRRPGARCAGVAADALGLRAAMWIVAALTMLSGVIDAARMRETLKGAG